MSQCRRLPPVMATTIRPRDTDKKLPQVHYPFIKLKTAIAKTRFNYFSLFIQTEY